MEFGLAIPTRGPLADRASIEAIATRAEALGFSWLAVPDHLIVPRAIDSRYPYSDTGAFPGSESGECLEQFTLLAFLAAITTRARLLTSVTVVPHRGAIETAKLVSTIDNLSGGRFTFGVGAGWMEEEFKAIQAPPFAARGRVTDEIIEACRVLWRDDAPAHDGEFFRFSNVTFLPKPVQRPGVPVWVGGESNAALRRTVRLGDTWFPIHTNPRHPLNTAAGSATAWDACTRWPSGTDATRAASVSRCGRIHTMRPARSNGSTGSTTCSPGGWTRSSTTSARSPKSASSRCC